MAEVINSGIMFDPLYQEIIQGLDEIVHESAEMGDGGYRRRNETI